MASRRFDVPEETVVAVLVGQWPIVRLRDDSFRELMEALPDLGLMRVFVRNKAAVIESVGVFGGLLRDGAVLQRSDRDPRHAHLPRGDRPDLRRREAGARQQQRNALVPVLRPTGDAAFKAFLWEDFPDVPASRIESFRSLARELAALDPGPLPSIRLVFSDRSRRAVPPAHSENSMLTSPSGDSTRGDSRHLVSATRVVPVHSIELGGRVWAEDPAGTGPAPGFSSCWFHCLRRGCEFRPLQLSRSAGMLRVWWVPCSAPSLQFAGCSRRRGGRPMRQVPERLRRHGGFAFNEPDLPSDFLR